MGWFDKAQYWMGRGMIKLDPTPGNVVVTKALPWYHRNIEQPWASTFARPVRLMFDPKMLAEENKYSSWEQAQRALNPWSAQRRKEYESWKSPWGVKGALEMSTPTNLIPIAAGPGLAARGLQAGSKAARAAGAVGTAGKLAGAASKAGKVAEVVGTIESHPISSVMHGPKKAGQMATEKSMLEFTKRFEANYAKAQARKAAHPFDSAIEQAGMRMAADELEAINQRAATKTAVGGMATPEGLEFTGAMKGTETGGMHGGPHELEGWHTPVNEGRGVQADMQGQGLPRGKFISLDKPFESDIHNIKNAVRTKVPVKNIYDPDGVLGPRTPSVNQEYVDLANRTVKTNPNVDTRQLYTDFLKSKGYDSYVRGIDGDPLNRELIVFEGMGTPKEPAKAQSARIGGIQYLGRPKPLEFKRQLPEAEAIPAVEAPVPKTPGGNGGKPPVPPTQPPVGPLPEPTPAQPAMSAREKLLKGVQTMQETRKLENVERAAENKKKYAMMQDAFENYSGAEAQKRAKSALSGGIEGHFKMSDELALSPADLDELHNGLKAYQGWKHGYQRLRAGEAINKIATGNLADPNELIELAKVYPEIAAELFKKQAYSKTWFSKFLDWAGLPKSFVSAFDLSAPLRQNFFATMGHPMMAGQDTYRMVRAFGSEKYSEAWDLIIKNDPAYEQLKQAGLYLPEMHGPLAQLEESFPTTIAEKIPGVRASNRAYTMYGKSLRFEIAKKRYAQWVAENGTKGELEDFCKVLNWATGRGDLGPLERYGPLLNLGFWSPRYMSSRMQLAFQAPVKALGNRAVAKELARDCAAAAGTAALVLGAIKIWHPDAIETDPRSTDFGKIKVGNTRLDFLSGGYQPYVRYAAQVITGQRKSAGGTIYKSDRAGNIGRFLRSKEAPLASFIHDVMAGETFVGDDVKLSKASIQTQMRQRLVPMFVQDVWDAVDQEGMAGAALSVPGAFGGSVTSYGPESKRTRDLRDKVAKEIYRMSWEEVGTKYGRLYQQRLEQSDARLKKIADRELEAKLEEYAHIPKTAYDRWQREQNRIKTYSDKGIKDASDAMMSGEITPSQFRLRVDEVMGQARAMRQLLDADPQYDEIKKFTRASSDSSVNDVAYQEYLERVYAPELSDAVGRYDYTEAENRKQAIRAKYGDAVYSYIQQALAYGQRDDPAGLQELRQARETLKPYWGVEDKYWAMHPQLKRVNDQIKYLEATNPDAASRALKRYPGIVALRKRIAAEKKMMRLRNPRINRALVFYR